jgi:hypothetical protein
MKHLRIGSSLVEISISRDELLIINNALNEVCNGIEVPEFETRIGATMEMANALLQSFGKLMNESRSSSP